MADLLDRAGHAGALPAKIREAVGTHPAAVLVGVGCASFVGGWITGSRLGRAVIAAAVPLLLQRVIESEIEPRVRAYFKDLLHDPELVHAGEA
jgi:hypothetical protein